MSEWKKEKLGGTEMSKLLSINKEYAEWLKTLSQLGRICNPSTSNISIYNAKK